MEITSRRFLPTDTRAVHAATIEFWNDHPVFAWFGGTREGANDVAIHLHNLEGEGETTTLGGRDGYPRWNPILFSYDDRLYMFEKIGVFCDRWQTYIHDITDWSKDTPEKEKRQTCQILPAGLNGPVKTKPILFFNTESDECSDGNPLIACGSAVETFSDWTSYLEFYKIVDGEWVYVHRTHPLNVPDKVFYRSYNGVTKESQGIIQPALWTDEKGELHSFFRSSHGLNKIFYYNHKVGENNLPVATNLPNPNSGVDIVNLDNRLFLVNNPSADSRIPLVIQEIIKVDESEFKVIDEIVIREKINDEDRCNSQELSYPYMVENNGQLHLVYTYGRSRIEYVIIDV